eukprot:TCALIF_00547-PA protein Name:"Similar to T Transposable element P transposase (Drosophila melanogaster)" AED:0.11 eAED:0.11 QI:71/0.5/0.33/0.66/1/1/3/0/494
MSSEFQAVHLVEENDFSNPLKRSYRTCAVGACPSPNGASYHNFPKDPKVQKRWLLACQRQGSIPAKYGRICHHHFAPECFERDLKNELLGLKPRRLLKPGSVPTLRLDRNQRSPQCLEEDESPRAKRVKKREAKEIVNKLLSHSIIQEEARKATVQIDNELKEKKSVGISCKIFHEGQEAQLLKDKIQSLREKLRTANLEVNSLKKQVKYLKSSGHRRQDVKKVLEKTQTPAEVKRLLNPGQKHWRYSQEDMIKALVLKSMSNRTYEYLRKSRMIALPSRLTVDRWLKNSHTTPGIQHDCLKIMKETCLTFENERDSLAVLSFDKIDLKNRHEFDSETETIYGERYQTDTVLHMQIFSDDSTRLGPEEALGRVQILLLGKNYDFLIKNPYGRFEGNNEETATLESKALDASVAVDAIAGKAPLGIRNVGIPNQLCIHCTLCHATPMNEHIRGQKSFISRQMEPLTNMSFLSHLDKPRENNGGHAWKDIFQPTSD